MRWLILGGVLLISINLYCIDINSAIHYTLDNGLPTNNIHSIEQDSLGYIWIATEAGLSRFNGATFYNYTTKNGLVKNEISDLIKRDGRIFLSSNGPFGYIEDAHIQYLDIPVEQKMNWNFSIALDSNNTYIASQNQIVSLTKNDLDFIQQKGLKFPLSFVGSYKGQIYGIGGPMLYCLKDAKLEEKMFLAPSESNISENRAIHYLLDDKLFYMVNNDLYSYEFDSQKKNLIVKDLPPLVRIKRDGSQLIMIHLNGGYTEVFLDENVNFRKNVIHNTDIVFTDFLLDSDGNKWFSTVNEGLYFVPKKINGISKVVLENKQTIDSPISIFIKGDSTWLGNSNAELTLIHNQEVQSFKLPSLNRYGVSRILDIKELSTGDLIISSDIGVLLFINNSFEYIFRTSAKKLSVKDKKIIINTYQSSYLLTEECLYKLINKKVNYNRQEFLGEECVLDLDEGRSYASVFHKDEIYVAKVLDGLLKIKDDNKSYLTKHNKIYSAEINDLAVWNDNYIAVASAGEGFYFSEIENPENIIHVEAVSSSVCYALLEHENQIYVGTNKGIYFVTTSDDVEKINVQLLSQKHGLLSNEIRDLDIRGNKLYALTSKGLNVIDLDNIEIYNSTPNLRIENIIVNQNDIPIQEAIKLEPHENDLSFLYNKIDFSRSDNLNYAYRLIGIDDDWHYTNSTEAKFPNLKSGKYTFQVGVAQAGQVVENKVQEINIDIRTAFINSIWAKLIGISLFLIGSYFFLLTIISRRNIKRLEQSVFERTQELNEKVDEIQQINHQLKMSNSELQKYAHIASHDLKSPIRTISSFVSLLEKKNLKNFSEKDLEYVGFIKDGVTRMSNTVNDLLELSKVDTKPVFEYSDLNKTISNILDDLHFQITNVNAEIIIESDLPTIRMQKTSTYQLFQNLISNALKYNQSNSPKVWIDVNENSFNHEILIRDNGIGIEPEYQKDIFEIFRRLHGNDEYDGTGIGLALCMKIVTKYGGTIDLESEVGVGTTFIVRLPKRQ